MGLLTLGLVSCHICCMPWIMLNASVIANDWGKAGVNITQKGDFYKAPYKFKLTLLPLVAPVVKIGAGIGRV